MEIGFKIRALRKEKGLTLKQLSKKSGLSISFISDIENNRRNPNLDNLNKLAISLNTSADKILSNDSENNTTFTTTETTKKPELSKRVKKEITEELENFRESLLTADGLMFDGEPASEEDVEKLLDAMQVGMEMIRLRNKEKFTPKKYKK